MNQETKLPLQYDMFSGALVDRRTARQKKRDREQKQPKQMEMFSQREIAQFGVNPHPLLPLSPHMKLVLIAEDPRTDEEKERDLQRAAAEKTCVMFGDTATTKQPESKDVIPDTQTLALVPRGVVALVVIQHVSRSLIPFEAR